MSVYVRKYVTTCLHQVLRCNSQTCTTMVRGVSNLGRRTSQLCAVGPLGREGGPLLASCWSQLGKGKSMISMQFHVCIYTYMYSHSSNYWLLNVWHHLWTAYPPETNMPRHVKDFSMQFAVKLHSTWIWVINNLESCLEGVGINPFHLHQCLSSAVHFRETGCRTKS